MTDDEIQAHVERIRALWPGPVVMSARTAWEQAPGEERKFATWHRYVLGIRADGRPRFGGFVLPYGPISKATADIIKRAIEANRLVYALSEDGSELRVVVDVVCVDAKNAKAGWSAVVEG